MPQQRFVVHDPASGLYLSQYNIGSPQNSIFDNLNLALEFATLEQAQQTAAAIGGGTVGTTKP